MKEHEHANYFMTRMTGTQLYTHTHTHTHTSTFFFQFIPPTHLSCQSLFGVYERYGLNLPQSVPAPSRQPLSPLPCPHLRPDLTTTDCVTFPQLPGSLVGVTPLPSVLT